MKRIIIIGEGPTEQEFCRTVLLPHFAVKNIAVYHPVIKKSGRGIVSWKVLRKQIENHLRQDSNAMVTTLIDYYGIHKRHAFSGWEDAQAIVNKSERVDHLEAEMNNSISEALRHRFIAYIQLHEFEALLFNIPEVLRRNFTEDELTTDHYQELKTTIAQHPNPEEINNNPKTAPSKRLEKFIKGYNKIVYGSILAEEIGLEAIRNKSPRFHHWITLLESI